MNILFLGSFQHYSALILKALIEHPEIHISGVITTPPKPVGRKKIITKTPVHELAEKHHLPILTPEILSPENISILHDLSEKPDYFITAGYGKILPPAWLEYPKASLNLHFSLLPAYRGANPAEWVIMCNEIKTGITLITMSQSLDTGDCLEQFELPITSTDTRETLYQKLYTLGAKELPDMLIRFNERCQKKQFPCQQSFIPKPQPKDSPTPYAALLKREDGCIPWKTYEKYMHHLPLTALDFPSKRFQQALEYCQSIEKSVDYTAFLERLMRALTTYPSLWTIAPTTKGEKRLIIHSPTMVQLEGKEPAQLNQIKNQFVSIL